MCLWYVSVPLNPLRANGLQLLPEDFEGMVAVMNTTVQTKMNAVLFDENKNYIKFIKLC